MTTLATLERLEALRQEFEKARHAAQEEALRAQRVIGRLDATIDWLQWERRR